MNKTVIEVQVRAVLPTSGGCAVFIGNNDKVFIIYVDQTVGSAITMFMRDISKERPLTHDLMAHLMTALAVYQMWKNHENNRPVRVVLLDGEEPYVTIADDTGGPRLTVRDEGPG